MSCPRGWPRWTSRSPSRFDALSMRPSTTTTVATPTRPVSAMHSHRGRRHAGAGRSARRRCTWSATWSPASPRSCALPRRRATPSSSSRRSITRSLRRSGSSGASCSRRRSHGRQRATRPISRPSSRPMLEERARISSAPRTTPPAWSIRKRHWCGSPSSRTATTCSSWPTRSMHPSRFRARSIGLFPRCRRRRRAGRSCSRLPRRHGTSPA